MICLKTIKLYPFFLFLFLDFFHIFQMQRVFCNLARYRIDLNLRHCSSKLLMAAHFDLTWFLFKAGGFWVFFVCWISCLKLSFSWLTYFAVVSGFSALFSWDKGGKMKENLPLDLRFPCILMSCFFNAFKYPSIISQCRSS